MKKPQDPKSVKEPESIEPPAKDGSTKISQDVSPESDSKTLTETQDLETLAPDTDAIDQTPADAHRDDEPRQEDLPADALPHDDLPQIEQPQDDEHGHRTFAATALMILVGVLFIASVTLWAAPKMAPYLPAGVAKYLTPGQADATGRLASLDEALAAETAKNDEAVAALRTKLAAISGQIDVDTESRQAEIDTARSAAEAATTEVAALSARLDTTAAEITALRDEFSAVSAALTEAGTGEGAAAPEIAAAVAALGARLDSLAANIEDGSAAPVLGGRIAAVETRLEAVEASTADARDAQSEALGEASSAIRQTRLQAAFDLMASRLTSGQPYSAKLNEIAALSGAEPPAPLAAGASAGLASATLLKASFARYAQAAVAADVQASAGDGRGLKALGWLRAQVAGRPTAEQEGAGVGAITSRITARVGEGKLAEALAETVTLPEHSQVALGPWLGRLRERVDADAALIDWRTQIGVGG